MIVGVANLAVAAVTAVLTISSGRNMFQTWNLSRQTTEFQREDSILPSLFFDTTAMAIGEIQAMKRKDLMKLYFSSRGPQNLQQVRGEWNGILLDNNGFVMVGFGCGCRYIWKSVKKNA
jgi:hypothetical protein